MRKKANQNTHRESERGVTLLLAILILAALVVIVFSAASIAINETRTSGDVVRSEPSITAAEAGAEDALFLQLRGAGSISNDCAAPTTATLSNGVTLNSCTNLFYPNPYGFALGAVGTNSNERDLYLYDPTNINTNPGYSDVTVYMDSGTVAKIDFCLWNNADCAGSPDNTAVLVSSQNWDSGPLNGSQKYQLFVINTGPDSAHFTVKSTPKAIPAGTTTLQTTGVNNNVRRKVQTVLP